MNKNLNKPDFLEPKEDPEKAFSAYMVENGFDYIEVIADGKIHRFGDNKHGWYIMFPDGPCPAGAFGSFKTGEKYKWSAKNQSEMTPAERLTFNNQMAEAKKKREAEQARRNEAARKKAEREWDAASPAPQDHPYLQTKGVLSYGLKVNQTGQLVVPIAAWWYRCFPGSQVYTAAAPPESNLKKLLWGEIGGLTERHPDLFSSDMVEDGSGCNVAS